MCCSAGGTANGSVEGCIASLLSPTRYSSHLTCNKKSEKKTDTTLWPHFSLEHAVYYTPKSGCAVDIIDACWIYVGVQNCGASRLLVGRAVVEIRCPSPSCPLPSFNITLWIRICVCQHILVCYILLAEWNCCLRSPLSRCTGGHLATSTAHRLRLF